MCSFELPPETATGPGLQRLNQAQTALVEMLLESAFAGPARLSLSYWNLLDTWIHVRFRVSSFNDIQLLATHTARQLPLPMNLGTLRVNNSAMGRREAASVTDTVLEVLPGGVALHDPLTLESWKSSMGQGRETWAPPQSMLELED